MKMLFLILLLLLYVPAQCQKPVPTKPQLAWQKLETNAFLHFTVNTFTGKEWGDGTESPAIFNPVDFDARKLIRELKNAGFKMAIITAKHHDGFCLWPSKYTDHSVKSSPWKNGKGDVVKEIADACKEYGVKFGFYLSPWDRHEPSYGTDAYNTYYKNQLIELLTNYGVVSEVWFDGAKGPNAKNMKYDFEAYWNLVKKLQPNAVIFSDAGPGIRWVGNETGNAGETCWSTINTQGLAPGNADPAYLNTGDPHGNKWVPAETDVSIRPGWFYHESEDSMVKSSKELVNLYYQSVGRNSLLLLNIPPNKKGVFNDRDIKSINGFHSILSTTFKHNLVEGSIDKKLTDNKLSTYLVLKENQPLEIHFSKSITFNRALFQENIEMGQLCENALLEFWNGEKWLPLKSFTTIGYKRLLRFSAIKTSAVRFTVVHSKNTIELSELGLYLAENE